MNDSNSTPPPPPEESLVPMQTMMPGPAYVDYRPPPATPPAFAVERYLSFLKKKWWILLLMVLVFGGLAAAYIQWWPVSYVSKAHVWMAGKIRLREGALYDDQGQNFAGTQVELLQTDMIQRRALARVSDMLHVAIPTNSDGEITLVKLKAVQVSKSSIMELKATGPTEAFTSAFLNATMEEFLAYKEEVRKTQTGDTYTSVTAQINREEGELKAAQDKLTAYMKENNVAVLEEQAKAAGAYLTSLLTELSQLELEYKLLEAASGDGAGALAAGTNALASLPSLRRASDGGSSAASAQSAYAGAQQEIEKLKVVRERFSKVFRPKHPKMVRLDEEIAQAERLVEFFSHQSREQLASSRREVKVRMEGVQQAIKQWEANVGNASERIAEGQRLKLEVDRKRSFYDHLLNLLQSVDVSRNLEQENLSILDRASQAKPRKLPVPLVAALGLVLGIFAGLGLVFLVERRSDRLTSMADLAWRFEERIVGQVPEAPKAKRKAKPALLEMNDDRHLLAESYRGLRSSLLFGLNAGEKPKVLLVTSAIPGEGKSTMAANLARTLAFAGARVLLVDADLRRGLLHELFGVAQAPGLADLLANGGDLSQFVIPIPLGPEVSGQSSVISGQSSVISGQLHLLPRGQSPHNAGELLLGPECDRFLARARQEYDRVIIDSIPVFAADDTTSLAPRTDGVIFVVRNSFASTRTVRSALELLYDRQAMVLGLVYNRANSRAHSYDYYKYNKYYARAKTA
jgi:capsular exopolysaccharide synthesis family protein